ncbi:SDR family oxidoreductase [Vibrio alginolyticus]|uniref:NAD-dependent epimerase/dehydratase family protein n=1 Tax=Vibrio alginolyticus TaxID=663 RepID=UPI002808DB2E|nr:SDR family oxidoreductase [Vibrio alginolyticus]ELB1498734.1 SDR family oxidoreductase [Vibrio alginolyticus]
MTKYTVFGGSGFIGSEFVKTLKLLNHDVYVPDRNSSDVFERDLGIIIYCAGYGDCIRDPFNVLQANTILLSELLKKAKFDKLIYLSSTRVYMNSECSMVENNLTIEFDDNRKLFNLTKLAAEELCAKSNRNCLIIRPSNVFGAALKSDLFLPSITRNAILNNVVDMYVDKLYAKDYIFVSDLVRATLDILNVNNSNFKIVNVASGENTTAKDIADVLVRHIGCKVVWHDNIATNETFPITDVSYMSDCISFKPLNVLDALEGMIEEFKGELNDK